MLGPVTSSDPSLCDLELSSSRSFMLKTLLCQKALVLSQMIILYINRKSYMGYPAARSQFNLNDRER